ncbi:Farnesylcysteine lyase [Apiospora kogelbergensis]|uniref:Farnesylcysteine lyase n=1 Tax=Apiospora kogelbergensis TaxID=1337665 RepID=A0AAW0QJ73_9PEZI
MLYFAMILLHTLGALAAAAGVAPALAADVAAKPVKQVAVIGAGAAGASTAYHLHKYAEEAGIAVNITIFEKNGRVGGRTLTVNAHENPGSPVELGASIFVKVNHILWNATDDFNLVRIDPGLDEKGVMGVWDGDTFVYTQDSESLEIWHCPYYVNDLVQQTIGAFLKLYEAPYFPFRSLTTRAFELGLVKVTGVTGRQLLAASKLDGSFAHDIVQAASRVNYMSNLDYIHGLGAMFQVSMAAEGAKSVLGGNWWIFASMVKASKAHLNLNTTVVSIAREDIHGDNGEAIYKYIIKTSGPSSATAGAAGTVMQQPVAFDDVVIATPWQFSDIEEEGTVIEHPIEPVPYAKLHVTLFSSPFQFSARFFNLDPASPVPNSVLTTLADGDEAKPGATGAGKAGFFSATQVKKVVNPMSGKEEYVYKIFSPEAVTSDFLSSLLGVNVPDTFVLTQPYARKTVKTINDKDADFNIVNPISWYHPAVFHPYPQKLPRVTFQDPILGRGLYYTSGMESFISTMETSALMGKNVARLIVDDYLGVSGAKEGLAMSGLEHDGEQIILGGKQPVTSDEL